MDSFRGYAVAMLAGALLMALSFVGIELVRHDRIDIDVKCDTVIVHDTVHIEKPVARLVRVVDTLLVPVTRTVTVNDTVFIQLGRTEKIYSDDTYKLQVSGYQPQLDFIEVYPTTTVVTKTVQQVVRKKSRWGIGIQAGYGASKFNNQIEPAPYVGVGISYNFIRW